MNGTLAAEWAAYLVEAVPDNASPDRVRETRRAFHAGAAAMLAMLADIAEAEARAGGGPDSEELGTLRARCWRHLELVTRGVSLH